MADYPPVNPDNIELRPVDQTDNRETVRRYPPNEPSTPPPTTSLYNEYQGGNYQFFNEKT